ncbi:hypothetical protein ACFQZ4_22065 [Catellatospora coxensis]|uniref:Uncharacterized protein n=1 Tax=Catellatospora coxensis TaxID=310354 RepID=A0A8J3L226_9ACTN|nr:hypothetical protein [Catellatospora coxensis]GIG05220.1 hypothetical protein Cco03nite_19200 [Catellatospora coxensis]
MNDYRDTLDEYVGTAPRTAIDIDDLVHRGRRAERGRRIAAASGGLVLSAVAALSAVSLLGAVAPGPGLPVAASAAVSTPSTRAETPDERAQRLLEVLQAAIAREAPGVTGLETLRRQMHVCSPGATPPARLVPYDAATFDAACPADSALHRLRLENFDWLGQLTVGGVTTAVRIHVGAVPAEDPSGEPELMPELGRKLPGGGAGVPGAPAVAVMAGDLVVQVVKPDGTLFFVGHPEKRTLPWTELWQAVGVDPALHL